MEEAVVVLSRYCPSICSGGLSKNAGNFSQSSGCPGRCSNLAPPVCIPRTPTQPVWLRVCLYIILYYFVVLTRKAAMLRAKNRYFSLSIVRILPALQYEFLLGSLFCRACCMRIRVSFSTRRIRMRIQGPDSRCGQPSFEEGSLIS